MSLQHHSEPLGGFSRISKDVHNRFNFWEFSGRIILFKKNASKNNEIIQTWINIIISIINKWNAYTKAGFERDDYLKLLILFKYSELPLNI